MFEKELVGLVMGIPIILGSYWFTLRRGPYRVIFRMAALASVFGLIAATLGAAASHAISVAGTVGIALAATAPIFLMAFINEIDAANEEKSKTNKWRLEDQKRRAAQIEANRPLQPWEVDAVIGETKSNGEFDGRVKIRIRQGSVTRTIGEVNPIDEVGEYHRLMNEAQEHASTYETLGVVSESKALQKYDAKTGKWE